MKNLSVRIFAAAATMLVAYLLIWPVPISPQKWNAPDMPGYQGVHAVNTKLANLQTINIGKEEGPEHLAIGPDGKLYAAMASGAIVRMAPDGSAQEVFVNTGGRVLGFDFDAAGNLIAADAIKGLLSIAPDKKITVLADSVRTFNNALNPPANLPANQAASPVTAVAPASATKIQDPIRYADAVVVAKNGKMYVSDASAKFAPKDWGGTFEASVLDILEQSATGRIIEYDPATKTTRIVAKGMTFANGVALSADEQSIFVNETGKYRVWRIDVAANELDVNTDSMPPAAASPQARIVLANLPGYPDNLMRGLPTADGKAKIWLGFAKPRGAAVDKMAGSPLLRKITMRLPRALWPIPPQYGHVMAFTEDGQVVADLQDPTGAYPESTGVTETADRLYIQSLHAKTLGWIKK